MVNLYLVPLKSKFEKGNAVDNSSSSSQSCIEQRGNRMTAKAVLLCRPNSHPFQERTLLLDQSVKVGRSVARARPAPNNGIFDCKVLSRNHALLWYENGKFYLQDTKSSNGTFVNNQRLSKGSEESAPREVCSGDIVQFGVDVLENSRKVTHGCIVATLKLYLPDGKEAKASPSTAMLPSCPSTIATQDLYQLSQYLQEALHREQVLENKLSTLQKLIATTEETSESSWKALIDEDRLLTRLEILENQVQTCSKNVGEDTLRQEVVRLQEDKDHYQVTAKESLKKVLQEKLEAVRKLQDVERQLNNAENDCKNLQQVCEATQKELHDLAEKYSSRLKEIQDLTDKLQAVESKDKSTEKSEQDVEKNALDIVNDYSKENHVSKPCLEDIKNSSTDGEDSPNQTNFPTLQLTQGVQVDLIVDGNLTDSKENYWQNKEEIDHLSDLLKESEKELSESKAKVTDLNKLLDKAQVEAMKSLNKVAQLEVQLHEAKMLSESNTLVITQLQDKIEQLEEELFNLQEEKGRIENVSSSGNRLTIVYKSEIEPPTSTVTLSLPPRSSSPKIQQSLESNGEVSHDADNEVAHTNNLKEEIEKLKELLAEARENKQTAEREVTRLKDELEDARNNVKKVADDSSNLRQQLQAVQLQTQEKTETVSRLQDQLKRSESSNKDFQQQFASLKEKLSQDQQRLKQKQEEVDVLKQQLLEAQHSYKQAHNEAEQLRNKVESLSEQLERQTTLAHSGLQLLSVSDEKAIRDECASLRSTIRKLESDLRQAKNEKAKVLEEYKRLSEMPRQTEAPVAVTAVTDGASQDADVELLREEVETAKQKLMDAYSEIVGLKETCEAYNEERTRLKRELNSPGQDYQISEMNFLPLLVILILILVAFYPKLALITATLDPTLPSS